MDEGPSTAGRDGVVNWVLNNKLRAIFSVWATGIAGTLAWEWTKPIPPSLKLIHGRVYAQGITLTALGAVAALELWAGRPAEGEAAEREK